MLGWSLLGFGGAATFMAKPTSALVLGGLISLYLVSAGKLNLRGLGTAIVVSFVVVILVAVAIDGSPFAFVYRINGGKQLSDLLQAGHGLGEIVRWDPMEMNNNSASVFSYFMFGSFLSVGFVLLWRQYVWPWSVIANAAILIAIALAVAGIRYPNPSSDAVQANQLPGVSLGIAMALFILPGWHVLMTRELGAAVVLLLPMAYAAGTNTNLWAAAGRAGTFWLLAGMAVAAAAAARDRTWEALPLTGAMEAPYRQTGALRLQTVDTELSAMGSHLLVGEDTAAYVAQVRKIAADGGFRGGDSLIDLTGTHPATAFFLNAQPPASVWMAGGYPGAMDYASEALRRTPCSILAASWILLEEPSSSLVFPPGDPATLQHRHVS